jgi:Methane oxygenase PmoA
VSTITVAHTSGMDVSVRCGDVEIVRYVYGEDIPPVEAPKPYLHPIRTLSGALISAYRPHDHRWHKGLQMTISHLSGQNFWGGPTYVRGQGYVQLGNVGSIRHESFSSFEAGGDRLDLTEQLGWFSSAGQRWCDEERRIAVHGADEREGFWVLDVVTCLVNVREVPLEIGSPTTHGREMAGYTGWFFRGARAWTGGTVIVADPAAGQPMGTRSPWLAYTGPREAGGGTLLMINTCDLAGDLHHWFVRTEPFPAVNPSFAFFEERTLEPGGTFEVGYRVVVADAVWDRDRIARAVKELT